MRYNRNFSPAFTLVELIVVITIIGILSTVWFVSYSNYLTWARDSNRYSQLTKLSDSLQVYATTKSLPLPDDYIEITASWATNVIAYQGYVGTDVLETIDYTNGGKDPKDDSFYTYYLTKDRKSLQLMALMEEAGSVANNRISNTTFAADYSSRFPKVYGKKLWILVSWEDVTLNVPAQEVPINIANWSLDIVFTSNNYISFIDNNNVISWTWTSLSILKHSPLNQLNIGENLVWYWDLETWNNDGTLRDLTQNIQALNNTNWIEIGKISNNWNTFTQFNWVNQDFRNNSSLGASKLDLINNFTISTWINPTSYHTVGYYGTKNLIFIKWNSLSTINYSLQITDENTITFIERGVSESLQFTWFSWISSMTNRWTHVLFTFKNNNLTLYIDWNEYESKNTLNLEFTSNDRIFIWGAGTLETQFDGYIDEIKVFNTVLSKSQIEKLYSER